MTIKIACVQMNSGCDVAQNIAAMERGIRDAAKQGAQMITLPENCAFMRGEGEFAIPPKFNDTNHPAISTAQKLAKELKVEILLGSLAIADVYNDAHLPLEGGGRCAASGGGDVTSHPHPNPLPSGEREFLDSSRLSECAQKLFNRAYYINTQGEVVATYDKIHLFDVDLGNGEAYRESDQFAAGNQAVMVKGVHATLGLTICYDVRFPHLYRGLAQRGAEILCVPAAFTQRTGEAHWHVLLRARAIENGCFVVAPAQTGTHANGRQTFGHSLIIDPWGEVLADAGKEVGVIVVDIDVEQIARARKRLPSLSHDREFGWR